LIGRVNNIAENKKQNDIPAKRIKLN